MSGPAHGQGPDHEVSLSLHVIQAVDPPESEPRFYESVRDGHRKRIYESLEPEHYFHLEYQLLPAGGGQGQVFRTDVVMFGVVSKVYTEQDSRVVQSWQEDGLSCFGWRHKHSFKVNKALLLELYDHVLEVRVWNSKEKLSARARYDRPKAFRLPAPGKQPHPSGQEEGPMEEDLGMPSRPAKFPIVCHDRVRTSKAAQRKSKRRSKAAGVGADGDDLDASIGVSEVTPPSSPRKALPGGGGGGEGESQVEKSGSESQSMALVPLPRDSSPTSPLPGLSRRRLKRLEAEAAEQARVEREGVAVLRLRLADLFAKKTSITARLEQEVGDLRGWEVGVSLESPLMPESLRRELNPITITVAMATGLPPSSSELQERCEPVYVKYQFHTWPEHRTSGKPHATDVEWRDPHIILLGTLPRELLVEYLRGPPLVVEVHDRDRRVEGREELAVFGREDRDEVLGTHAFSTGLGRTSEAEGGDARPWDPYGVALFNLSGLLEGQRMIELTTPITNGPRAPEGEGDSPTVSPMGRALPPPLPPGDYLHSQSELTLTFELTYPLPHTSTPTPLTTPKPPIARTPSKLQKTKDTTARPSVRIQTPPSRMDTPSKSPSKQKFPSEPPRCPFGRLVYVISSEGHFLVERILSLVNEVNSNALGLQGLPADVLPTALSTYKLTNEQISSAECDVLTGFHVEDWEQHLVVLEGLRGGAVGRLWEELPRTPNNAEGLLKVFFNSDFSFSRRLYGSLDVDLPRILLCQPLSKLIQQSVLYVHNSIPHPCFRALVHLSELSLVSEMADVVRNDLLPSAQEVAALSLQFAVPAGFEEINGRESPEGEELERPHTPVPMEHRRLRREWEPLDLQNKEYLCRLRERRGRAATDFLKRNILHSQLLSEQSAQRRRTKRRLRSLSESAISRGEEGRREGPVHVYSSQTLNSTELAKARLREQLVFDPAHRYTYCQYYHSMTVVPIDVEAEQRARRLEAVRRWRTRKGFVYPGVASARECNSHTKKTDPARTQELEEPFEDNLLHASTLKPTVARLHFRWEQRLDDFERYQPPPLTFGTPPPITIHLAGSSRARELQESLNKDQEVWRSKVVVKDTQFYMHRKGNRTELSLSGPEAGTQLDKLQGILKDSPEKYTLREEGLRLEPTPALDVVHNPSVDPRRRVLVIESEHEGSKVVGYRPGPCEKRSLKLDGNVIPIEEEREGGGGETMQPEGFRLYYHIPSVLSKRPIVPLSEKTPLFSAKQTATPT